MDIGSVFLILAVALLAAIFVSRPFLQGRSEHNDREARAVAEKEHLRSSLLAEQDRVLNTIQELDFDYALAKIPEEEYSFQREALLHKGAELLRQIDALQEEIHTQTVEERIEAAVAARRVEAARRTAPALAPAMAGGPLADDELERLISARRSQRQESAAGFCPKCGRPVQKTDRFCPKCGNPLSRA
jgi:NADH pyrophosphatase NudC (nudix superfamily)